MAKGRAFNLACLCYTVNTPSEGAVMSTTFTMRIDEGQKKLISEYANMHSQSMSEFLIESAMKAIEDQIDLDAWNAAKAEYDKNPVSYSTSEAKQILGLA